MLGLSSSGAGRAAHPCCLFSLWSISRVGLQQTRVADVTYWGSLQTPETDPPLHTHTHSVASRRVAVISLHSSKSLLDYEQSFPESSSAFVLSKTLMPHAGAACPTAAALLSDVIPSFLYTVRGGVETPYSKTLPSSRSLLAGLLRTR